MTWRISSDYGPRPAPLPGGSTWHAGVDVAAPIGTPVHAAAAGTVIRAGYTAARGNVIELDHGGWTTLYQHLHVRQVAVGDTVEAGQQLGTIGATGLATGAHLHLEYHRNGKLTNPAGLVPAVMEGTDMPTPDEIAAAVWRYRNERLEDRDAYAILRDIPHIRHKTDAYLDHKTSEVVTKLQPLIVNLAGAIAAVHAGEDFDAERLRVGIRTDVTASTRAGIEAATPTVLAAVRDALADTDQVDATQVADLVLTGLGAALTDRED